MENVKRFNTTGPCFPDEHYMLPALDRLPGIRELVAGGSYFVVHAPRQTGKTTVLQSLVQEINEKGDMFAIYCTLETMQNATDVDDTMIKICKLLRRGVFATPELVDRLGNPDVALAISQESGWTVTAVSDTLAALCRKAGKPVVVFFDEADCLVGDVLISFLRQLRDGYVNRKLIPFPKSIALVGMLDVRDYKAQIRSDGESLGQISPFNIIAEDMLIPNFTEPDIRTLYAQHTAATGQVFADGVVDDVWRLTRGQPWLVNAIAHECVAKIHGSRYDEVITVADVEAAKEAIIRRNPVHLDYLFYIASYPSIKPFFDAALNGSVSDTQREEKQFRLLLHLGLLCECGGGFEFSNPVYKEYWAIRKGGSLFTNDNCNNCS